MKTVLPNYIIQELKIQGKKAKQDYSHNLAGHLDHQFFFGLLEEVYKKLSTIDYSYTKGGK